MSVTNWLPFFSFKYYTEPIEAPWASGARDGRSFAVTNKSGHGMLDLFWKLLPNVVCLSKDE